MKVTRIKTIYKKEILDLLRDKKTLIIMVLVPLLLYPLIMMGSLLFGNAIASSMKTNEYVVAVSDEDAYTTNGGYSRESFRKLLEDKEDEVESNVKVIELDSGRYDEALENEEIDTYVEVKAENEKNKFTIYYLSSNTSSSSAADIVDSKLELYSETLTQKFLEEMGLESETILQPIETVFEDKSANEEKVGNLMGMILPFLLVTSILMGAFYPAVDTTAGEKERGTLETLLTMPLRNDELIIGKFLAVATIAVASAILNLLSMLFMSMYFFFNMQGTDSQQLSMDLTSFIPAIIIVILCVIAFAFFMSAVTMCVTTFAKSFKEANNYETPLMLVVMFASFVSFVPNIEFNGMLASIPIVNICLLLTNILVFKYNLSLILIVLITNIAYAALAIMLLIKLFDSEEMLFGEGGSSIQLFTGRSELRSGGVPNLSDAIIVMAIGLLLLLYVGSTVQNKFLLPGLLITQIMVIALPLFVAWYTKKNFKATFHLNSPKPLDIIAALLIEAPKWELPSIPLLVKICMFICCCLCCITVCTCPHLLMSLRSYICKCYCIRYRIISMYTCSRIYSSTRIRISI